MQKPLIIGATTLTLLFGGSGVANATELMAPAPATTTTVAQQDNNQDNNDNTGLWGLAGLLGLLGLAGLMRRKDANYPATRGTAGGPTIPPAPRA
jgi:hypothetical protein